MIKGIVTVKRLRKDIKIPEYHTGKAAGFDLAIADRITVGSAGYDGQVVLAGTGLVIAAPVNHFLYITFRSSTPRKYGVTVLEGIVDEDYCGDEDEIKLQIMNLSKAAKTIPAGTRLAQGLFIPVTQGMFCERDVMGESRGGFGSTG